MNRDLASRIRWRNVLKLAGAAAAVLLVAAGLRGSPGPQIPSGEVVGIATPAPAVTKPPDVRISKPVSEPKPKRKARKKKRRQPAPAVPQPPAAPAHRAPAQPQRPAAPARDPAREFRP